MKSTISQTFSLSTRLQKENKLNKYMRLYLSEYSRMYRFVFKELQSERVKAMPIHKYSSELQQRFNISKRVANTLIRSCKGRFNALKELKQYELSQLRYKIKSTEKGILDLKDFINSQKDNAKHNLLTTRQLQKYRKSKEQLYWRQQRLNKLNQKLNNLENNIKFSKFPLCFGSKRLFKAQYYLEKNDFKSHKEWLKAFRRKRDRNIYFLGSKSETGGNNECYLVYDNVSDNFKLRIRVPYFLEERLGKWLEIENIDFKYQKDKIIECLKEKSSPFTFRIRKKGYKLYLDLMITLEQDISEYATTSLYGTVGIDFNRGFIEMSETDRCGNLVYREHLDLLIQGTSKQKENVLRQAIAKIVKRCADTGKDLSIENLDFKNKKATTKKKNTKFNKEYNKMINSFEYAKYLFNIENSCFRNKVTLKKVNPMWTSYIGKYKYSDRMKLNIHQSASYVIARLGQGLRDRFNDKATINY